MRSRVQTLWALRKGRYARAELAVVENGLQSIAKENMSKDMPWTNVLIRHHDTNGDDCAMCQVYAAHFIPHTLGMPDHSNRTPAPSRRRLARQIWQQRATRMSVDPQTHRESGKKNMCAHTNLAPTLHSETFPRWPTTLLETLQLHSGIMKRRRTILGPNTSATQATMYAHHADCQCAHAWTQICALCKRVLRNRNKFVWRCAVYWAIPSAHPNECPQRPSASRTPEMSHTCLCYLRLRICRTHPLANNPLPANCAVGPFATNAEQLPGAAPDADETEAGDQAIAPIRAGHRATETRATRLTTNMAMTLTAYDCKKH